MSINSLNMLARELGLTLIPDIFDAVVSRYGVDSDVAKALFIDLMQAQKQEDDAQSQLRMRKNAKLRWPDANLQEIDFKLQKPLTKALVSRLAKGEWVNSHGHLVFVGPTGTAKTTLACAFSNALIGLGYKVLFERFYDLLIKLQTEDKKEDRKCLSRLMRKLELLDVLIIDDWCLTPLSISQRRLLFDLIERREGKGSMIITSQFPPEQWYSAFGDDTTADAILDRIVHCANIIDFKGKESFRKLNAKKMGGDHVEH